MLCINVNSWSEIWLKVGLSITIDLSIPVILVTISGISASGFISVVNVWSLKSNGICLIQQISVILLWNTFNPVVSKS